LGNPERVLDAFGGTDIIATLHQHVTFNRGTDLLACLSVTDGGPLRWYTTCCNTPIGNTARNPKVSYVGLVHTCLDGSSLDAAFGPTRVALNTARVKGKVKSSTLSMMVSLARILGPVFGARVSGAWRRSPFFAPPDFEPVAQPRVLSSEERERARNAVDGYQ
jgi:hypothetical protein